MSTLRSLSITLMTYFIVAFFPALALGGQAALVSGILIGYDNHEVTIRKGKKVLKMARKDVSSTYFASIKSKVGSKVSFLVPVKKD